MLTDKDSPARKRRKRKKKENMKNGVRNKNIRKRKRTETLKFIENEVLAEKEKKEEKGTKELIHSNELEGNTTKQANSLVERKIETEDHCRAEGVIQVEAEQRKSISKSITSEKEINSHQYDIKMNTN
jgi:hypothetical protein